jgi:5'(3')-deoxyribonucleotidase
MPTIYLDMDGVLADFNTAARKHFNASREEQAAADAAGRWSKERWATIRNQKHFYRDLPPMPQADNLLELARRFRDELGWELRILTAIPHNNDMPEVFQDKFDWVQEYCVDIRVHFGPYSRDKQYHAEPGDILVDDRASNCAEWRQAGGIAVRVLSTDYQAALDELDSILERKLSFRRLAGHLPSQG